MTEGYIGEILLLQFKTLQLLSRGPLHSFILDIFIGYLLSAS